MIEKPQVRSYQPGDESPIVELLRQAFNDWPRQDLSCTPLEHWTWKFLDTPIKKSFINVGEPDKEISALMKRVELRYLSGSRLRGVRQP